MDVGQLLVIEASAPYGAFIEAEPQWPDEVQAGPRVRAEPDHVAGVGRNLGFVQHDVKHCRRIVALITRARKARQRSGPAWV
jgi:hypothetical protein